MKKTFISLLCIILTFCSCSKTSVTHEDVERMEKYAFRVISGRTYDTSWKPVERTEKGNNEYIVVMQNSKGKRAEFIFQIPLEEKISCIMTDAE